VAGPLLICTSCGKRAGAQASETACTACGAPLRPMTRMEALFERWFGASSASVSECYHRHRQLTELLWSRDGRGQEYYNILRPGISYSKFLQRVTDIVCQGVLDGWIELRIPPVPVPDDSAYGIEFKDPDRFAAELTAAFARPDDAPAAGS
jgi:hypothetical protein